MTIFNTLSPIDLSELQITMLKEAQFIAHRAYNIYSGFFVGACVYTKNGNLYRGTFLENVSFGLTTCAEVSALLSALNNGDINIESIAIVGGTNFTTDGPPVTPCGRCRQVISEFSMMNNHNISIICSNLTLSTILASSINDLLPSAFLSNGDDTTEKMTEFKTRISKSIRDN